MEYQFASNTCTM